MRVVESSRLMRNTNREVILSEGFQSTVSPVEVDAEILEGFRHYD